MEIIIAATLIASWYGLLILPTKWLKVERVSVPIGMGKRVLHMSDLHVERNRVTPGQIKAVIAREEPDYIMLTGDLLQRKESLTKLEPYLAVIQSSGVPAYAVMGNHDHEVKPKHVLDDLLQRAGITLLQNESLQTEDFTLVGLDDACTGRADEKAAFAGVEPCGPVLVLCHDPNYIEQMEESFDLMLSGHLHGKQLNVPFLFKVKPMGVLTEENVYKGLHKRKNGSLYITKGVGQMRWNIRFGVRSEVTVLDL